MSGSVAEPRRGRAGVARRGPRGKARDRCNVRSVSLSSSSRRSAPRARTDARICPARRCEHTHSLNVWYGSEALISGCANAMPSLGLGDGELRGSGGNERGWWWRRRLRWL